MPLHCHSWPELRVHCLVKLSRRACKCSGSPASTGRGCHNETETQTGRKSFNWSYFSRLFARHHSKYCFWSKDVHCLPLTLVPTTEGKHSLTTRQHTTQKKKKKMYCAQLTTTQRRDISCPETDKPEPDYYFLGGNQGYILKLTCQHLNFLSLNLRSIPAFTPWWGASSACLVVTLHYGPHRN